MYVCTFRFTWISICITSTRIHTRTSKLPKIFIIECVSEDRAPSPTCVTVPDIMVTPQKAIPDDMSHSQRMLRNAAFASEFKLSVPKRRRYNNKVTDASCQPAPPPPPPPPPQCPATLVKLPRHRKKKAVPHLRATGCILGLCTPHQGSTWWCRTDGWQSELRACVMLLSLLLLLLLLLFSELEYDFNCCFIGFALIYLLFSLFQCF